MVPRGRFDSHALAGSRSLVELEASGGVRYVRFRAQTPMAMAATKDENGHPPGTARLSLGRESPLLRLMRGPVGVGNPDSRSDSPGTIGRCCPSSTS